MKRHKNKWVYGLSSDMADMMIRVEQQRGFEKFGKYHSWHEAYAIIKEELEEFWDSVKEDDPDPEELVHVCATARRALIELCAQAREEFSSL